MQKFQLWLQPKQAECKFFDSIQFSLYRLELSSSFEPSL